MCSFGVTGSPKPPEDPEDVSGGYEPLIYDAISREGEFSCFEGRDDYAYGFVQDYRDAGPWPDDPLL